MRPTDCKKTELIAKLAQLRAARFLKDMQLFLALHPQTPSATAYAMKLSLFDVLFAMRMKEHTVYTDDLITCISREIFTQYGKFNERYSDEARILFRCLKGFKVFQGTSLALYTRTSKSIHMRQDDPFIINDVGYHFCELIENTNEWEYLSLCASFVVEY